MTFMFHLSTVGVFTESFLQMNVIILHESKAGFQEVYFYIADTKMP